MEETLFFTYKGEAVALLDDFPEKSIEEIKEILRDITPGNFLHALRFAQGREQKLLSGVVKAGRKNKIAYYIKKIETGSDPLKILEWASEDGLSRRSLARIRKAISSNQKTTAGKE